MSAEGMQLVISFSILLYIFKQDVSNSIAATAQTPEPLAASLCKILKICIIE